MSTELSKKTEARNAMAVALQRGKEAAAALAQCDEFSRVMVMAEAVSELREAMTDKAMSAVMSLAGTSMGFRTDKDRKEGGGTDYPIGVVRECLIEAMLRGVSVVGNQFNIIANRFYMTKEGWDQRLKNVGAYEVLLKIGTAEDISEMRGNN